MDLEASMLSSQKHTDEVDRALDEVGGAVEPEPVPVPAMAAESPVPATAG